MKNSISFLTYFCKNHLWPSCFILILILFSVVFKEPLAVKCFLTILGILLISSCLSYIRRFK